MLKPWPRVGKMDSILVSLKLGLSCVLRPGYAALLRLQPLSLVTAVLFFQYPGKKGDIYNILWALVFGFATLNILGLVARRFEPDRTRMSFGEVLAIMVVLVSICLLGWEILTLLHIFPIQLKPR
jgi:hypothetical protein